MPAAPPGQITAEALADLVTLTLKDFHYRTWLDLSTDIQQYCALPQFFRMGRITRTSGPKIVWHVQTSFSDTARAVALYEVDQYSVKDYMTSAEIGWRHMHASYAWERRELLMNREPQRIINLLETREHACLVGLAHKLEEFMFTHPAADDGITPYGLLYWVTKKTTGDSAPTGPGEFGGPDPWPGQPRAGLSFDRFRNWTHSYQDFTKDDLLIKLRRAFRKTHFISPDPYPALVPQRQAGFTDVTAGNPPPPNRTLLVNHNTLEQLERLAENQNENLGRDLGWAFLGLHFRNTPIKWVPFWDERPEYADDPIYGINWDSFKIATLEGDYLVRRPPRESPTQHNVYVVDIDLTYNTINYDPRSNFVLARV